MIRRPPRSTLFPYNDALPISRRASAATGTATPQRINRSSTGCNRAATATLRQELYFVHGTIRRPRSRSEEHTSELQSQSNLVCRLLLEKKKKKKKNIIYHTKQ